MPDAHSIPIYQVDAFSDRPFGGNPAAICPLTDWLPDALMQQIAMENNLSETAFFVVAEDGYHLRWFTPRFEVDLCGHATLAAAHVLFHEMGYEGDVIRFDTRSGLLPVQRTGAGRYKMDFPADEAARLEVSAELEGLIDMPVAEAWRGRDDYMLVVANPSALRDLMPNLSAIKLLDARGLVVSAPGGDGVDFVSRCFFPLHGIDEDPVTGSAHTMMVPYWAARLGKSALEARQVSARGGRLHCTLAGGRVLLEGQAVTVMEGRFFLPEKSA